MGRWGDGEMGRWGVRSVPITDFLLPIPDSRFPIPDSRFPSDSRFP
ncbi:hypothetical protein [Moorena sp. SIO3H5]|nr:hypothetical protein [Moorena sp. SIO3H5]NEO73984.1 hypothetical protein [Moorena sp. SIO3H5]